MKKIISMTISLAITSCGQNSKFLTDHQNPSENVQPTAPAAAPESSWAAYCGDSVVNQFWEECDGGESCNSLCQDNNFEQATRSVVLAQIQLDELSSNQENLAPRIHLGGGVESIPSGVWFALSDLNGNSIRDGVEPSDINGSATVSLLREDHQLSLVLTPPSRLGFRHLQGSLKIWNSRLWSFSNLNIEGFQSEWPFDGLRSRDPVQDEFWSDNNQLFFWMTVQDDADGVVVEWR